MERKTESASIAKTDSTNELNASSLKLFYDSNLSKMDRNHDGHVLSEELNSYKAQFDPLSKERRQLDVLSKNIDEIEYLSNDPGFHFFKQHGIKAKDMEILSARAPSDGLVSKVNSELADRDYERALSKGTELTQDNTYLVELAMGKTSYTFDWREHIGNIAQREYKTTIVGERQYDSYQIGQTLSSQADWIKLFSSGLWSDYWVAVNDKHIEKSYSWTDENQNVHPIPEDAYAALKSELVREGKTIFDVAYQGANHSYISDKPLSKMKVVSRVPMSRHFFELEIGNESLSLSLSRQLRNMTTRHRIEVEVPEDVYDKSRSAWETSFNRGSLLLGKLNIMTSDIKKRWTELDPSYEKITTSEGRKFIVKKYR